MRENRTEIIDIFNMDNESDSDVGDILNDLLANDDTKDETAKKIDENEPVAQSKESQVHDGTLDSINGRDTKNITEKPLSRETTSKTFDLNARKGNNPSNDTVTNSKDVYSDPFFGFRIVNPTVSSAQLQALMADKMAITMSRIKSHLNREKMDKDWVIAGVLISKSAPKTSQKGSSYSIWKITDLSEDMNVASLFMFSNAYKALWKTTVGTVISILNPNVLESKDSADLATLSIDNPQRVMILGKSKDMGKCRSKKKNGEPCNSIVNINRCEFCLYHIKREYKMCSHRAELQAFSNTQKFSIDMLKEKSRQPKKSLTNNMPEFRAVVAVRNKKLEEKDAKRLALLSGSEKADNGWDKNLDKNEKATPGEGMRKEINKTRGWKFAVLSRVSSQEDSPSELKETKSGKNDAVSTSSSSSSSSSSACLRRPRLGIGCLGGTIDLSEPITTRHVNVAKSNAIKWVKENGKIKARDPNKIGLSKEEKLEKGKKRPREDSVQYCDGQEAKRANVLSDKFKEIMSVKSIHTDLIERSYDQRKEKYFDKLEMKERMEERMLATYKLPCKAVTCLLCKYTSFSASDLCKEQKHPLRVLDAVKKFFKCADCGNRAVSLDRIPSHSCIKCSSSNWRRAAMMDERKTNISIAPLCIRGDEETFLGSITKDANLNLLVPEKKPGFKNGSLDKLPFLSIVILHIRMRFLNKIHVRKGRARVDKNVKSRYNWNPEISLIVKPSQRERIKILEIFFNLFA
ncbi:minichromosome maintenance 10 homolog [Xylocopa sonorina]|uniref:minichromosome maintenance 10 homolog n=1 Tax=Xylocopa sonorina TaxID=1818115 RepID=UPI00403AEA5A